MKRLLISLVFGLAAAAATAQPIGVAQGVSVLDSGTACSVANTCAVFGGVAPSVSVAFTISGTFTGTLTFEASGDGGSFFSVLAMNSATGANVTTTTATGLFSLPNPGYVAIRARATAWTSGTALVSLTRGAGSTRLFNPVFSTAQFGDGTVAAPSITFSAQTTTGFLRGGSGLLDYAAASYSGTNPALRFSGGEGITIGNGLDLAFTASSGAAGTVDTRFSRGSVAGEFTFTAVLFANLGTPANGHFAYCSDCTIANPCASGGTGAWAKRLNGVWVCN